ncbi:hypothetical protein C8Q76DRAFT_619963, partial [Earliella scabrosa]
MDVRQLCLLYKAASLSDIETRFGASGINRVRRPPNLSRQSNRVNHTVSIQWANPDAITPSVFGLDDLGIRLHPRLRLAGRDIEEDNFDEPVDELEDGMDRDHHGLLYADQIVDRIWAQFPYDLIQISPNLKSRINPAYTTLTSAEQQQVTLDLFKRPFFPFRCVWYRERDFKFWYETQFARFFPPKGQTLANVQNYGSCRYMQDWMRVMTQVSHVNAKIIRKKMMEKFKDILWLPHTETTRIWDT